MADLKTKKKLFVRFRDGLKGEYDLFDMLHEPSPDPANGDYALIFTHWKENELRKTRISAHNIESYTMTLA